DIWFKSHGFIDECMTITNGADQFKLIFQQALQTLNKHLVIVSNKNSRTDHRHLISGTLAVIVVPVSGLERISKRPCSSLTRSSELANPIPLPRRARSTSKP